MNEKKSPDVAVVVLSCDKYSDLWMPFFTLYFLNWSSVDLPVYLCSNREIFDDVRVTTALSGEDPDWSTSIKTSIEQIPHDYVLLVFDDVFFNRPIDKNDFMRLLAFIRRREPSYLRFRPHPKPDERVDSHFGRIHEKTLYRTSVFGLWKRSTLLSLMRLGETAWEFERLSPERACGIPDFYGVYHTYFSYIHGIEKGLWVPSAYKKLLALGVQPDLSRRRLMTQDEEQRHIWSLRRERVFNAAPAGVRPLLIGAKRSLLLRKGG